MKICVLCVLMMALVAGAESEPFNHSTIQPFNSYTNHAGNVASGVVVALDARTATISNAMETVKLPLSIFPESEQRRIAADFGQPRVPVAVKRAVAVQWTCSGTFTGKAPFAGVEPNGRAFSTTVMNFYKFDDDGLIVDDIAATGMLGILQGIGAD